MRLCLGSLPPIASGLHWNVPVLCGGKEMALPPALLPSPIFVSSARGDSSLCLPPNSALSPQSQEHQVLGSSFCLAPSALPAPAHSLAC